MNTVRMFHHVEEFEQYMMKQATQLEKDGYLGSGDAPPVFMKERSKHAAASIEPDKTFIASYVDIRMDVESRCFLNIAERPLLKAHLEKMGFSVFEGQTMFAMAAAPGR